MILLELKHYIKAHHQVRLVDIQNHFDLTTDAAQALLQPLLQQGKVQALPSANTVCQTGHCRTNCVSASRGEEFVWVEKSLKPLSIPVKVL